MGRDEDYTFPRLLVLHVGARDTELKEINLIASTVCTQWRTTYMLRPTGAAAQISISSPVGTPEASAATQSTNNSCNLAIFLS